MKIINKDRVISQYILVDRIWSKCKEESKSKITKKQIELILDKLLTEIKDVLIKGDEVIRLVGLFTMKTVIREPRKVINLRTKTIITVPSRKVPRCIFSNNLKNVLKKQTD